MKALILAHETDNIYGRILKATVGIIFLATPHQGTTLASWATLLSNVVNAVSLGQASRTQLLQDLRARSETLMEISRQFVQRSVPLKLMTFTEQEVEGPLRTLVITLHFISPLSERPKRYILTLIKLCAEYGTGRSRSICGTGPSQRSRLSCERSPP
jgi:hypothetical protein